jgi:hypothetical protein
MIVVLRIENYDGGSALFWQAGIPPSKRCIFLLLLVNVCNLIENCSLLFASTTAKKGREQAVCAEVLRAAGKITDNGDRSIEVILGGREVLPIFACSSECQ